MHISARPHDPHANGGDYDGNEADSGLWVWYLWLADLVSAVLFMPT